MVVDKSKGNFNERKENGKRKWVGEVLNMTSGRNTTHDTYNHVVIATHTSNDDRPTNHNKSRYTKNTSLIP